MDGWIDGWVDGWIVCLFTPLAAKAELRVGPAYTNTYRVTIRVVQIFGGKARVRITCYHCGSRSHPVWTY